MSNARALAKRGVRHGAARATRRLAVLALGVCAALAPTALGAQERALLAGDPVVKDVSVAQGADGRVVLDVRVVNPAVSRYSVGRLHRAATSHIGAIRVRARGPGGGTAAIVGARAPLLLGSPGGRVEHEYRVQLSGDAARRVMQIADGTGRATLDVTAATRLLRDGDRRARGTASSTRVLTLPPVSQWADRVPPVPRPNCERARELVTRDTTTRIAIRCANANTLTLASGPSRGTARLETAAGGRAIFDYVAPPGGRDRLAVRARGPGGAATAIRPIVIREPVMRALGDSVTAGFGYLGDGTPMSIFELPSCIPPTPFNDRCSSNSSNGPGAGGAPAYLPDYGLSNQVAWSAQFAARNGLSGSSSFQNLAVSGSTPSDWLPGGQLSDTLAGIVADNPDLTVMTLGANPLLDDFLFGGGLRCELTLSEAQFEACIEGFINRVKLVPRVEAVIAELLEAPSNHVVVSQYHQAIPSSSIFSVASLRLMTRLLNDAVAEAVRESPEFGERVFLMSPPLFTVGVPPGEAICTTTRLGGLVDGPSVQSVPTQDELSIFDAFSFCGTDVNWIISGDTGIHPSRLGHAQFADALERVVEEHDLIP